MQKISNYLIISTLLLLPSTYVYSAIVNYTFTGIVVDLESSLTSEFTIGENLNGYFSVESDNPTIQPTRTIYSVSDLRVSIGDHYILTGSNGDMIITTGGFAPGFTVYFSGSSSVSGNPVNGLSPEYFDIQLDWFNGGSPLVSESLPSYIPLDTGVTDRSNINFPDDGKRLSFKTTSVQIVPVPPAIYLFGSTVLAFFAFIRRKV